MASLKDLRNRIKSVKATQKITKAMKMVAASKLRRARDQVEAGRPYSRHMQKLLESLAVELRENPNAPQLLIGNGNDKVHLLIVVTSDRGLAGALNSGVVRMAKRTIADLEARGKTVKLFCIGRKGYELLNRDYKHLILDRIDDITKSRIGYDTALAIARRVMVWFEEGQFDVATVLYNEFRSVISQVPTPKQLIPMPEPAEVADGNPPVYIYEPEEEKILDALLPVNLAVQIYHALLENVASEHGARMTAMENATRNAGEMIKKLTLVYNRSRQATITKELIEIISGAEAL